MKPEELKIIKEAISIIKRKAKSSYVAFTQPQLVKDYLMCDNHLREPERESFKVLFLDSQNRLITDEVLFYGTIDAASVYPRIILKKALAYNAAALIVSHNHPSGLAEPSKSEIGITNKIVEALKLVDIKLLDHFIVGDNEVISFAERGLL